MTSDFPCPSWLSEFTRWLSSSEWLQLLSEPSSSENPHLAAVQRYVKLENQWRVLDADAWERARISALSTILSEARTQVHLGTQHNAQNKYYANLIAIDCVMNWLRSGAPESERTKVMQAVAEQAYYMGSPGRAAAAACSEEATAVAFAGSSASWSAWWKAAAVNSSARSHVVDSETEFYAAANRVVIAVFDAIECEINAA